jgi:hypothetical protein
MKKNVLECSCPVISQIDHVTAKRVQEWYNTEISMAMEDT